jgi:hypothetical protein
MLELGLIVGGLFAGGGLAAVVKHFQNRAQKDPVGIALDAAKLAEKIKQASADRKITASELKELAEAADALAARLK